MYPLSENDIEYNSDQLVAMTTDYMVKCPNADVGHELARQTDQDVYVYSFDFFPTFLPSWLVRRCRKRDVCHAVDLPYTFHSLQNLVSTKREL
jgi:carboxylesterase type B